ncbi:MAG: tetratricopeptide repeat protein [Phycisphaerales bacterium]|nr:MAG: tetratricopeptide repeat protein [Phycisphaerales bacterium]
MNIRLPHALTLAIFALIPATIAARGQEPPLIEVSRLTDHLYKLSADAGSYVNHIIASVGDDGVLLVDTGLEDKAEALKEAVAALGYGDPKIIINTHAHFEHLGANAQWGAAPTIIAHERVRTHMRSGRWLIMEYPDEALPEITFNDTMSVHFNGEEIRLTALTGSHSDDDIIVHFTGSGVACLGGLINAMHFPSVDYLFGDVRKYPEMLGRALDMLPADTRVISGHGEECTMKEAREYQQMLTETMETVRKGLAEGKDLQTMQEEDLLKEWSSYSGGYVSKDRWIKYLVDGFEDAPRKLMLIEPLYLALKDGDVDAAIAKYHELKSSHPDEYRFDEVTLIYMGDWLVKKGRPAEGVKLIELAAEEYPGGEYTAHVFSYLGRAARAAGDRDKAIAAYRRALELNPDMTGAAEALAELEEEQR